MPNEPHFINLCPTRNFSMAIKSRFVYLIVLIPLECCSCRCTLSLCNAFMRTVSLKAGQSGLNGTRTHERTNERKNERTDERTNPRTHHHVTFLNLYLGHRVIFLDPDKPYDRIGPTDERDLEKHGRSELRNNCISWRCS